MTEGDSEKCPLGEHSGICRTQKEHERRLDEGDRRMLRMEEKLEAGINSLKKILIGLLVAVIVSMIASAVTLIFTRAIR